MRKNTRQNLLEKATLTRSEIIDLLSLSDASECKQLFQRADAVRKQYCGDEIHLRGIIEFSNFCRRNCDYCGLRRSNSNLPRYRLQPDEIIITATEIAQLGIQTVVLQSGEDRFYTAELVAEIISSIKQRAKIAITLSLGERSFSDYLLWFQAGADRYLLKHETINPELYRQVHSDMNYQERLRCLSDLKTIGYQVGAGNMIGLPGQTTADIADDILFLQTFAADMAGIGPFIPNPDTPLAEATAGNVMQTLITLAVARIVLKNTHLPTTTALATLAKDGRKLGLRCGANVIMANFTPLPYRQFYQIYPGKVTSGQTSAEIANYWRHFIHQVGRTIATNRGDSLKTNQSHNGQY